MPAHRLPLVIMGSLLRLYPASLETDLTLMRSNRTLIRDKALRTEKGNSLCFRERFDWMQIMCRDNPAFRGETARGPGCMVTNREVFRFNAFDIADELRFKLGQPHG